MPQTLWFFIAFVIVLALIGVVFWLVQRFGGSRMGTNANRGRMPRLAVIDAAAVDGRRRLVLVRRDNVEHLLMIGGPTDVVVEPNIVRNMPQRDQAPQRSPAGTELPSPPRLAPEPAWAEPETTRADTLEHREPAMPEIPQRPARAPFADEVRRPAPAAERHSDAMPSFTPEPMVRPEPTLRTDSPARPLPRSERMEPMMPRGPRPADLAPKAPPPLPRAAQRPAESPLSSADQNLADMAQRLEAALRRPSGDHRLETSEPRAPSVSPIDRVGAPPVAPEPLVRPSRDLNPRNSSTPPSQPDAPAESAPKAPFENLEDEMASLLGRPKPPA
ncbi:flagellar biosynthetic protein FliO [Bradyrhizobium sp. SYSU BS000235]|uniref:flagellar biosynthetic protein FliO n=1 Tax=Bradyrhizobium sp. SYSU BS000235 TaxID=3411332 RepID=UPI003C766506